MAIINKAAQIFIKFFIKGAFNLQKGNYDEWIKRINELIQDKEKINQMGINGHDFIIKNFLWEQIANEFLEIIKKNNLYF